MKRFVIYKSTDAVITEIDKGTESHESRMNFLITLGKTIDDAVDTVVVKVKQVRNAIVLAPVRTHAKIIRFRLKMTDKYLQQKAEACEAALKAMAISRKKLAEEQLEARTELKAFRNKFNY